MCTVHLLVMHFAVYEWKKFLHIWNWYMSEQLNRLGWEFYDFESVFLSDLLWVHDKVFAGVKILMR
jgi:hypothetical protein